MATISKWQQILLISFGILAFLIIGHREGLAQTKPVPVFSFGLVRASQPHTITRLGGWRDVEFNAGAAGFQQGGSPGGIAVRYKF